MNELNIPDPKMHFKLSMWKSAVRILAGIALCMSGNHFTIVGGAALILAELIGIAEEMVWTLY